MVCLAPGTWWAEDGGDDGDDNGDVADDAEDDDDEDADDEDADDEGAVSDLCRFGEKKSDNKNDLLSFAERDVWSGWSDIESKLPSGAQTPLYVSGGPKIRLWDW